MEACNCQYARCRHYSCDARAPLHSRTFRVRFVYDLLAEMPFTNRVESYVDRRSRVVTFPVQFVSNRVKTKTCTIRDLLNLIGFVGQNYVSLTDRVLFVCYRVLSNTCRYHMNPSRFYLLSALLVIAASVCEITVRVQHVRHERLLAKNHGLEWSKADDILNGGHVKHGERHASSVFNDRTSAVVQCDRSLPEGVGSFRQQREPANPSWSQLEKRTET